MLFLIIFGLSEIALKNWDNAFWDVALKFFLDKKANISAKSDNLSKSKPSQLQIPLNVSYFPRVLNSEEKRHFSKTKKHERKIKKRRWRKTLRKSFSPKIIIGAQYLTTSVVTYISLAKLQGLYTVEQLTGCSSTA